jgi:hypothetical protein
MGYIVYLGHCEDFLRKLKAASDRIIGHVAGIGFGFIYLFVFPVLSLAAKKSKRANRTNWQPWRYTSDSIEDLRRQY